MPITIPVLISVNNNINKNLKV